MQMVDIHALADQAWNENKELGEEARVIAARLEPETEELTRDIAMKTMARALYLVAAIDARRAAGVPS